MAVQRIETFAWGAIKRPPTEIKPGTALDLGTHTELKVLDSNSAEVIQGDAFEWKGAVLEIIYRRDEINKAHVRVEGGLLDALIGRDIVYNWAPSESAVS